MALVLPEKAGFLLSFRGRERLRTRRVIGVLSVHHFHPSPLRKKTGSSALPVIAPSSRPGPCPVLVPCRFFRHLDHHRGLRRPAACRDPGRRLCLRGPHEPTPAQHGDYPDGAGRPCHGSTCDSRTLTACVSWSCGATRPRCRSISGAPMPPTSSIFELGRRARAWTSGARTSTLGPGSEPLRGGINPAVFAPVHRP